MSEDAYEKMLVIENMIEAQVIAAVLTEEGIDHRIQSYHDSAYDGIYQLQKGWGVLLAPAIHHDQIQTIVEQIRSGAPVPEAD